MTKFSLKRSKLIAWIFIRTHINTHIYIRCPRENIGTGDIKKRKLWHISIRHLISFEAILFWNHTLYPTFFSIDGNNLGTDFLGPVTCPRIFSTCWSLVPCGIWFLKRKTFQGARYEEYGGYWTWGYCARPKIVAQTIVNDGTSVV